MQVTLLGPVSCRHEGRDLPLGGLKQRAVFTLLALDAGRVVAMDRLIDDLWPDDPPAQAVVTLRAYVSRLRKVLEPTPAGVVTRPPGWVLTLPRGSTDLGRFTDLLARGRDALAAGGAAALGPALQDLDEALGSWSGDALGNLTQLRFARDEATRLEELRDTAVEVMLEGRLAAADHEVVVERARRFVAGRPFRERAWCALMIGLYRTGRQAEALETYAALRRTLADELGLDPSPALQDLERQMLRQDPVLQPPVTLPARAPGPSASPAPAAEEPAGSPAHPVRTAAGWPVVGRDRPLAALRRAVAAAAAGQGGLLEISAPMGAGKTTVLQALEDDVVSSGGRVLHGHGVADGAAPALWPWVTVLRDLVDALPDLGRSRRAPDEPAAAALAAMGPTPTGAEPVAPLGRSLLFRGVLDLLREARTRAALAVVIDDAQWVDVDTRTLVALATEELAEKGVLLVAAVRSDEPTAELSRSLGSLRRDLVTRVSLDPLDEDDVAVLIESIDGREPAPGVARAVLERTGGNALFVTELVRLLSAEGRLTSSAAGQALPAEVLDVLGRRLDRLPDATVSLLAVAALLGPRPFDLDLLARVSGLDEEQVLDACEAALLAGLLLETGDGTGRFALSHGLVRETLVARLSTARRIHLHAKIAAALQQRDPQQTDEVLEVARQLVLAAPAVGSAAAIPYLVSAAEDALRRSATDAARATLTQALELTADVPDPAQQRSLRALVRGHLDAVRMWAANLGDEAEGRPEPALTTPSDGPTAAAWLGTVVATAIRGHYAWSIAAATDVLADRPAPVAERTAHYARGYLSLLAGDPKTARHELDLVHRLIAAGVDIQLPGRLFHLVEDVYAYRALLEHQAGDEAAVDVEVAELERQSALAEDVQVKCDFYLALLAAMRRDPASARSFAVRCRRLARRLDYDIFERQVDQVQAWADAIEGDPAGPARVDDAGRAYWRSGVHIFAPTYLMLAAEAYAHHGDRVTARQRVRESARLADELGERYLSPRLAGLARSLTDVADAWSPSAGASVGAPPG